MIKKIQQLNYKVRVIIVIAAAAVTGLFLAWSYSMITQTAYTSSQATAAKMQLELNGGTSPNGVLTNNFGGWKPKEFSDLSGDKNFAIIKEYAKTYTAGTLQVHGQIPSPPESFLHSVRENGMGQTLWWSSRGVHTFIQAYTYSYGDVRGYVIVGKSSLPYELKFLICMAMGAVVMIAVFYILFSSHNRAKPSKKSK